MVVNIKEINNVKYQVIEEIETIILGEAENEYINECILLTNDKYIWCNYCVGNVDILDVEKIINLIENRHSDYPVEYLYHCHDILNKLLTYENNPNKPTILENTKQPIVNKEKIQKEHSQIAIKYYNLFMKLKSLGYNTIEQYNREMLLSNIVNEHNNDKLINYDIDILIDHLNEKQLKDIKQFLINDVNKKYKKYKTPNGFKYKV